MIGGGAVWAAFRGQIWQIDAETGKTVATVAFSRHPPHFATPTLHDNLVLVGTMAGVTAVRTS